MNDNPVALPEVIHALIAKWRANSLTEFGGHRDAKCADELEAAALSGWSFCPRCPMQWIGPYTDCPGCQAQAAMKAVSDLSQGSCLWTREDEDADAFRTACGHLWEFTTGGPVENKAAFCPYCGGALVVEDGAR